MSATNAALILAWVVIILLGLALSGILRRLYLLERRTGGLQRSIGPLLGATAPSIDGLALGPNDQATHRLLVFVSSTCEACGALLEALPGEVKQATDIGTVAVLFGDDGNAVAARSLDGGIRVLRSRHEDFLRYGVSVTPFAVLLDRRNTAIAAEPIGSGAQLHAFLVAHVAAPATGRVS